jgi:hypothetical protein
MVTLHVADEQALVIMLAADGAINRMGTGSVSNTERDLFIGGRLRSYLKLCDKRAERI